MMMARIKRKRRGPSLQTLTAVAFAAGAIAIATNWTTILSLVKQTSGVTQTGQLTPINRTSASSCGVCLYENTTQSCETTAGVRLRLALAQVAYDRGDMTTATNQIGAAETGCSNQGECHLRTDAPRISNYSCQPWGKLACDYATGAYTPNSRWLVPGYTFMGRGAAGIDKWVTYEINHLPADKITIDNKYCGTVYVQSSFHSNSEKGVNVAAGVIPKIFKGEECVSTINYEDRGCQSLCGLATGGTNATSAPWISAIQSLVTGSDRAIIANRLKTLTWKNNIYSCTSTPAYPRNEIAASYSGYSFNTQRVFGVMIVPPPGAATTWVDMEGNDVAFGGAGGGTCDQVVGLSCNGSGADPGWGYCPVVTPGVNLFDPAKLEFRYLTCRTADNGRRCTATTPETCTWQ